MSKCIRFVLSASIVLCLSWPSLAQTNVQPGAPALSPVLQAYNYTPDSISDAGAVGPQSNEGDFSCWSKTTLSSSGSPSLLFNDVSFTAYVNMNVYCRGRLGDYTGRIVFYDYDTVIATLNSNLGATLDTISLTPGRHRITATFESDSYYKSSSAHVQQDVDKWPAPTALSSSSNPSTSGQDVTFTVAVTSDIDNPVGKVRFSDAGHAIGIAILDENGMATLTKKNLAVGTHSITAEYYGDSISAKTTSAVLTQIVNSASPTASLK